MLKRTIVRVVLPLAAAGSLLGGTAATVAATATPVAAVASGAAHPGFVYEG